MVSGRIPLWGTTPWEQIPGKEPKIVQYKKALSGDRCLLSENIPQCGGGGSGCHPGQQLVLVLTGIGRCHSSSLPWKNALESTQRQEKRLDPETQGLRE